MPDLVRIRIESYGRVQVAAVAGEVDVASVGDVRAELLRGIDNRSLGLALDLTGASYLDSAAVGMLFELAGRLRSHGQQLRLVVPEDALMRKTLLLTGVDRAAPLDADRDAALAAFGASPAPSE
jgi:anti-sigma B factor antagonist